MTSGPELRLLRAPPPRWMLLLVSFLPGAMRRHMSGRCSSIEIAFRANTAGGTMSGMCEKAGIWSN